MTNLKSGDIEQLELPKLDQNNQLWFVKIKISKKTNFEKFAVTTVWHNSDELFVVTIHAGLCNVYKESKIYQTKMWKSKSTNSLLKLTIHNKKWTVCFLCDSNLFLALGNTENWNIKTVINDKRWSDTFIIQCIIFCGEVWFIYFVI